jgi:hypothetical protein
MCQINTRSITPKFLHWHIHKQFGRPSPWPHLVPKVKVGHFYRSSVAAGKPLPQQDLCPLSSVLCPLSSVFPYAMCLFSSRPTSRLASLAGSRSELPILYLPHLNLDLGLLVGISTLILPFGLEVSSLVARSPTNVCNHEAHGMVFFFDPFECLWL